MKKKIFSCILIFIILFRGYLFSFVYAASPFSFTVTTDNNWGSGFCYEFTTENISATPVSDWVIWFELTWGTITSSFGGVYTNSGTLYEIRTPGAYADPMAAWQTVNMGFCGSGNGVVSNLELIDYAWMGGGGGPPPPWSILEDYSLSFNNLQLDVTTASVWGAWYCRDIIIENIWASTINWWQLDFNLDATLSSSYSWNFSQVWNQHTITPLVWNTNIIPWQSYTLWFCSDTTVYDYNWLITVDGETWPIPESGNQIGTGSVVGTWAYDIPILWDGFFPGTASGSVSSIKIKARVNPSLNMTISAEEIDLGVLVSGVASTGSLFIEVGTNAKSGVAITARSQNGGLVNTSDNSIFINNDTQTGFTDGLAESYTWASTVAAVDDSGSPSFSASGLAVAAEINENSTEHTIYSTNKSETTNLIDDVEFVVSTTVGAETPASDYEDRVTFTVTGNF